MTFACETHSSYFLFGEALLIDICQSLPESMTDTLAAARLESRLYRHGGVRNRLFSYLATPVGRVAAVTGQSRSNKEAKQEGIYGEEPNTVIVKLG